VRAKAAFIQPAPRQLLLRGGCVKRIQIERKCKVTRAEIARDHLLGVGKPVIITDATENWPARSKWTYEFFKTAYGSDAVTAWRGLGSGTGKVTTLSAYINFLDTPLADLAGIWTGKDVGKDRRLPQLAPGQGGSPFYLLGWFAFRHHPELYDDIAPAPYFVQDLVSTLNPTLRDVLEWTSGIEHTAVYIGPEGSLSPLHCDFWNTHTYLAQIRGRKRAILFSPTDSASLYGGQVDPEQPDFERFPLFDSATAYECVIEPGDTLLIPANWWHHVRGLEKSITLSQSVLTDSNFSPYMIDMLRNLPTLAKGIDGSPKWREELRIKWRLSDFSPLSGAFKKARRFVGNVLRSVHLR
jgi:Cupin-like domain